MLEKKGTILSVREDLKVFDCTIRDGGLVNNFYFKGYHVFANYQGDKNWYSYPEDYTFTISLTKITNK